ncbi:MAG: N,N-dimethylformamidase beta subunit family domain-containing protein [Actinomycetota bacterium]
MKRRYASAALGLALVVTATPLGAAHGRVVRSMHPVNPVIAENRLAGTDRWDIPWPGYKITDDRRLNIKGYATSASVAQGGTIGLRITTADHEPYTIDVYRLGYYDGLGGRHITHLGPLDGSPQPACITMPKTGMVTCPWTNSVDLAVPSTWTSGVYFAVLTTASKYQSEIMFTVTDPRPSDIVFVSSVNTYQAYNNFPYDPPDGVGWNAGAHPLSGRSLYDFNSPTSKKYPDGKPAVMVSFDRPYSSQYGNPGNGGLTDFEPMTIAYLEKRGYDVTYVTDVDVDADPSTLLSHKVVLVSGHSEYWSMPMVDGAYAARDAGVSLAFITSNEIYWQVRIQPNADGTPGRIVVGYKDFKPDPIPDPTLRTIKWRDLGRPEQELSGVQLPTNGYLDWGGLPLVPINTDTWPFEGTGLRDGVPINAELSGYEIDSFDPNYPAPDSVWRLLLARSPFTNFQGNNDFTQNTSLYCAHSGAFVFATGTMDWAWGLAPGGSSDGAHNNVRRSLKRLTANILNRMLNNQAGCSAAAPA